MNLRSRQLDGELAWPIGWLALAACCKGRARNEVNHASEASAAGLHYGKTSSDRRESVHSVSLPHHVHRHPAAAVKPIESAGVGSADRPVSNGGLSSPHLRAPWQTRGMSEREIVSFPGRGYPFACVWS